MRAFSFLEGWGFLQTRPQRSYALVAVILMAILMTGPGHCDEPAVPPPPPPDAAQPGGAAIADAATNAPAMPDEGKLANAPVARQSGGPSARSGMKCQECANGNCFGSSEESVFCDGLCYAAKAVFAPRSKGDKPVKYGKGCLSKFQTGCLETEYNIKPSKGSCVKGKFSGTVLSAYKCGRSEKVFEFFSPQTAKVEKGVAQEYGELGMETYYDFTLCTCAKTECNDQKEASAIK